MQTYEDGFPRTESFPRTGTEQKNTWACARITSTGKVSVPLLSEEVESISTFSVLSVWKDIV